MPWHKQEMRKGDWPLLLPGNNEAGWAFNKEDYREGVLPGLSLVTKPWSPEAMREVPDSALRYAPFFKAFDDPEVVTDGGSDFLLANTNAFHRILADGIPAESFATGANKPCDDTFLQYYRMNPKGAWWPSIRKTNESEETRWLHSDLKNVAFPYAFHAFEEIMEWITTTPASDMY